MSHTGSRSPAELRALVRERDGDDCFVCGKPIDFALPAGTWMGPSLEHVIPIAAGGSRSGPANLRLSHAFPCNHAKGAVHQGIDYAGEAEAAAGERHGRQVAAAIGQAPAAGGLRRSRDRGGERARQVRRAKTGARQMRGPWGGLIVVEERGPWGGIVTANYASLPEARSSGR